MLVSHIAKSLLDLWAPLSSSRVDDDISLLDLVDARSDHHAHTQITQLAGELTLGTIDTDQVGISELEEEASDG